MSYEKLEEHLKVTDKLLREHKLAVESESEDALAHCLQIEGRMSERFSILATEVLRLER